MQRSSPSSVPIRDKAERARAKFVETQALIDAIDRAIAGDQPGA